MKLSINTKLILEIKKFYQKNKNLILDIILFGSTIKGKENPKDLDILILYKDKKNIDTSYELKKILKEINVEITDKTYKEFFDESFKIRESILSEGYSLINDKYLSEGLGYLNLILFKYELKNFNKSERMRFYYSLYGRGNNQGILEKIKAIKFSDTLLLCPIDNSEKLKDFLEFWKIKYLEFPILIPQRLKNLLKL
jgi:predicted nucleotidyltransferase